MVRSILKKVKTLIKGDESAPVSTPAVAAETASPTPAPQAQSKPRPAPEASPAPESDAQSARKPRQPKSASGAAVPEPLQKAQQNRSRAQEEWRPGRKPADAPKEDGSPASGNGDRPRSSSRPDGEGSSRGGGRRRSRRPRSEQPQAGGDASSGERKPRAPRKPRADGESPERQEGERAPRSRGGSRRSGGGNRSRTSGDESAAPRPSKGKGFKFPRPKPEHGDWDAASYQVPEAEGKTRFLDLDLPSELLHAVSDLGYQYCTPIQAGILPALLDGRDGIGQAQTGTGKTAAFLMASFARMMRNPLPEAKNGTPRMLIIAPTRELVLQIEEEAAELAKYTPIQSLPVYGGLDYEPQKEALRHNVVDLVVATPGRLIDFLRSKVVDLSQVETLVLDEADRMLDMGFIPDVKRIVYATPHKDKRQTLFFSATFTDDVRRLAASWTNNPMEVEIEPESVAADTVDQTVFIVTEDDKFALTVNLLRKLDPKRCLIFSNRRDTAQRLCDRLKDYEFNVAILTGAIPQAKRVKTLEQFRDGTTPIVVATDVAGRGIHVEDVSLVINYHLPEDAEDYVHRIGRTGRAGAEGRSVCFASEFDSFMIPDIEKYIGRDLVCTQPEEGWTEVEDRPHTNRTKSSGPGGGGRSGGGGRRGGPGGPRRGGGRGGSRGGPRRR